MIGANYKFNGQSISRTTSEYQIGLDVADWMGLDVSDSQQDVQGFHGVKLSPTFARGRRVTLEGIILADNQYNSSLAIQFLQNLFALQSNTSQVELKSFIVTDELSNDWELQAKIKEPLSIEITDDDYMAGANRRWRVVLQAEDPRYYNAITQIKQGSEARYGGVKLGVKLGAKLNENYNEIEVNTSGNIASPLLIEITAINDINAPLTIKNITDGSFFGLDINAVAGDVIIINSNNYTATKNNIDILANRISGSIWPKAKGINYFSIYDIDGGLDVSDFNIKISYKDTLL